MMKRALALLICFCLAFPAWAAEEFKLADVQIQGNQRVNTVDILNAVSIKPGQTVTPADIDAAMGDIYKMERFSDITADISGEADASVLTFIVKERPLVRNVRFEGNDKLTTEKLREVITVKVPDIYDPFEVNNSVEHDQACIHHRRLLCSGSHC